MNRYTLYSHSHHEMIEDEGTNILANRAILWHAISLDNPTPFSVIKS